MLCLCAATTASPVWTRTKRHCHRAADAMAIFYSRARQRDVCPAEDEDFSLLPEQVGNENLILIPIGERKQQRCRLKKMMLKRMLRFGKSKN